MKFRTRLFLFYIGGVCLTLFILGAYFIYYEENQVRQSVNEQLLVQARLLTENVSEKFGRIPVSGISDLTVRAGRVSGARITIIDLDGVVVADTAQDPRKMENHKNRPEIKKAFSGRPGMSTRHSDTLKIDMVYVAVPMKRGGKLIGVIRFAKSLAAENALLLRVKLLILSGVLLSALLAVVSGAIALRQIIKPVLELQRLATDFSRGDLSGRVKFFGHDELADLGLAFNTMSQQLADSFAVQREEKRKLEVILDNLADGILVIDRKLHVVLANPAACEMLGLNSTQFKERPVLELVMNHHLLDLIQDVHQSHQAFESELTLYYPQSRHFQVFLAPLRDENSGSMAGSIVVLHDLTQLRRLERVRQDFVANVSHELRTPITTIKAMTETLLRGAWKDESMLLHYLDATDKESDRLANLVNDLLALARLDADIALPFEAFNLIETIEQVRDQFSSMQSSLPRFEIIFPEEILPLVYGNRNQIKQVLLNLLDNAFKYTSLDGRVVLTVAREGAMIMVSLADTGIGIPEEDLGRIFERFYRVDKARSRELGGTGLGLSIVKHIVEAHGGQVTVESRQGEGSTFRFTIPAATTKK